MGCTVSGHIRHPRPSSSSNSESPLPKAPSPSTDCTHEIEIELKPLGTPRLTCDSQRTLCGTPPSSSNRSSPQPSNSINRPPSIYLELPLPLPLELTTQQQQITIHIRSLLHETSSFQRHLKHTSTQTLDDLALVIAGLPPFSTVQLRTTLQRLHADLSGLFNEQYALVDTAALARLPLHFASFLALPLASRRRIAERLPLMSEPMRVMSALTVLRAVMERQGVLDQEVAGRISSVFGAVLADLKMRELDGVEGVRGVVGRWRVFGAVVLRRREEGRERVERVLRKRVRVSGELVELLEGLVEVGDGEE